MITRARPTPGSDPFDTSQLKTIPKGVPPVDTFERAPASDPRAPLAVGEARARPGKTQIEGTSFEPRSAVWVADKDGSFNVVLSDEPDLAEQLRQHKRSPTAHRMFMFASPAPWGRASNTLHGHLGMFQFAQDMGDAYFRAQLYIRGKVTLDLPTGANGSLHGQYRGRSLNSPAGGKIAGEFQASLLDLSGDRDQAEEIAGLCAAGHPHVLKTLTKTLSHQFVSVSRSNASVTRAIANMQVGPAASDAAGSGQELGFLAAQHALNALGWQCLARICDFYGIASDVIGVPSAEALADQWLWTKTRALRKATKKLTTLIAQCHGVANVSLHFEDAEGPRHAHRELYVAFKDKNEVRETRAVLPGIVSATTTRGSGQTLYVPIFAEHRAENGSRQDSLADEAATLTERAHKFFLRDGAGQFTPWEPQPTA